MAPPGRRRKSVGRLLFMIFTSAIFSLLLSSIPTAAAAGGSGVIGIDLGTEYFKAVLVKPGIPLEIVLAKDSKRKEAASVAFKPAREADAEFPERFYGSDSTALAPRFPNDVYANLKSLLGIPLDTGVQGSGTSDENLVELYKQRYPGLKTEPASDGRGTVAFRSNRLSEKEGKEPFLVEELLSMQLKQVKINAEALGGRGTKIQDAVIAIPPYFSAEEKRSVELAAELAGLNLISIMTDSMAVGLNYATTRTFPNVSDGQKPEYHVIYDMGAGSTSASVLRFQSRTVKDIGRFNKTIQEVHVLGTAWDKTLGGDAFNHLIVNDMVEKLMGSKKLEGDVSASQVKAHAKTMAKFWKESERLRQILSANTETAGSFENVYQEDVNFRYTISRAEFEKLAKPYAQRVNGPLADAITAAQLTFDQIDSVILHGGATRTPFVQKQLEQFDKLKIRSSVNADESAAFGAAFKGAALSPSFRVKEIRTRDTVSYPVGMKWKSGERDRKQMIFTAYSEPGAEKYLTVKNLDDFPLEFYQEFVRNGESFEAPILSVQTTNLTASSTKLKEQFGCIPANITTRIALRLNPANGLPEVMSGNVSCEVHHEEKKGVVEDVKEFFGLGSKKSEQQPIQADGEEAIDLDASSSSTDSAASTSSAAGSSSATTTTTSTASKETDKALKDVKVKVESIPFSFTSSVLGIPPVSSEEMLRIKSRLNAFDASDLARFQREEAFNELEGFLYRARDMLEDEKFKNANTKEALEILEKKISDSNEWLHGDGHDSKTKELKASLISLKDLIDPALKRKSETALRPSKIDSLKQNLNSAKILLDVMDMQIKAEESAFSSSSLSATESTSISTEASSPDPSASPSDDSVSSEGESSSSSTSTSSPAPKPTAPTYTLYTPSDLSSLTTMYESIANWLDVQTEKQNKLSDSDDPVLTVADMDAKLHELEISLSRIMAKITRQQQNQGSSGSGGKKQSSKSTKTTKSAKKTSKSKAGKKGAKSTSNASTSTTTAAKAKDTAKHDKKDEL
ncbi:lumenal Hsp70 protein [Myotisia sp. PD_48]|nr:lumenal Hsp70 protein [Myotisia sp. PD_48]